MLPSYVKEEDLLGFIHRALVEDVGDGDHSSLSSIPVNASNTAHLVMKDNGVIAGVLLAEKIFSVIDPNLTFDAKIKDGDKVKEGDIVFNISGNSRAILTAERLVLNCMQRMSGISTYTDYLNSLIVDSPAKLLDTRKTTPNFRMMEKWAVHIGGGKNHRFGLFDMVMLKDNHIDFAGSITKAINSTKEYLTKNSMDLKIEVEVRTMEEVKEAIKVGGIDRLLLDNMSIQELIRAVGIINGQVETEASGGITEKTIAEVARSGVDYISVGALTHSVRSLDMSLKAID